MRRTALVFALLVSIVACTSAPATPTPGSQASGSPGATAAGGSPSAVAETAERAAEAVAQPESVAQPALDAALVAPVTDPLGAAAQAEPVFSCDNEARMRSQGDVGPAALSIVNETPNTYAVFELDENGQRQQRAELPPGEGFEADTFESHPWVIARDGRCIGIVSAPAEIVIEPTNNQGPQPSGGPLFGPTPTAVASGQDAATLLQAAMLTENELPTGLAMTGSRELTDSDPAYAENGGQGMLAARWDNAGTSDVIAVVDLRALFESQEAAAAYLEARQGVLSEEANGMQRVDGGAISALGPGAGEWYGQSETESGVVVEHRIYLFTSGPFVAKVYVAHASGLADGIPLGIAEAAAARTAVVWGGGGGEQQPFPSTTEASLLAHIPSAIAATCMRGGEDADGVVASVACPLGGDMSFVVYVEFETKEAMDAYFGNTASQVAGQTTGTSCQSGPARATWSIQGTQHGEVVCYESEGSAFIEWTDDRLNIESFAAHDTTDWAGLYDFWANEAGPNP